MSRWNTRLLVLPKNLTVVAQTVARYTLDDPAMLAVQTARRLPHRLGQSLGQVLLKLPGTGTRALGEQITGGTELLPAARQLLATSPTGENLWASIQRRIAAEVSVSYGEIDPRDPHIPVHVRARAHWDRGDVSQAVDVASSITGGSSYATRLRGEAQVLSPDFFLTPPAPARATRQPAKGNKLTVAHLLTNSLPTTQSGYTLRSHRLLNALADHGTEILAYTRLGYPVMVGGILAPGQDTVDGITYRRIMPWRLGATVSDRLQQTADMLYQELSTRQVDVLHTTTNYQNALVAHSVAQALGVPWIYEVRGVMEETWVSGKKTETARQEAELSERFALLRARETQMCHLADRIITLSQTMKDTLVTRGIPAEKISLAPNAVEDTLFDHNLTPAEARAQMGLPEHGQWVGSVTSVVPYEGLDTLLEAIAILRGRGQDVRALIAGDGTARPSLERLAQRLGISDATVFTGKLPPHRAYLAHQSLDAFTVPRTGDRVCRTVTPLKPIEAMALGRPVIMSNIPPLAELVNNPIAPGAGKLFSVENPRDLADTIHEVLSNPAMRKSLTDNGRTFAHTRTWNHNAGTITAIYQEIAEHQHHG